MKLGRMISGNRPNRTFGGSMAMLVFILIVAVFMMIPMVLVVSNSFKPLNELWMFPPRLFPISPTFDNYADLMNIAVTSLVPLSRYLFNTLVITIFGTVGNILLGSMCAYALAKGSFPGRDIIFNIIVYSLMFNGTVLGIPSYLIVAKIGWVDSLRALIIPAMGSTLGLYLMKQFMESSIPDALIEAALIDGASQWTIFWKIVMPNTKPAWMTLMLLSVQNLWNMGASSFIFSEEKKTLVYAMSQISAAGIARAGVSCAISVVIMLVPIAIFIISQSNVMETMASSGMKD